MEKSSLNTQVINSVSRHIHQQFPETVGVQPKVTIQHSPSRKSGFQTDGHPNTYLLVYSSKVVVSEGSSMTRLVRVVVNEKGKILKISTSR